MQPTSIELLGTIIFAVAVLHTFAVKQFQHLAHKYPEGSVGENFFHLLGEIEVVFGFWAGIFLVGYGILADHHAVIDYLNKTNFTEPAFVFVIMGIAATRPVTYAAMKMISLVSSWVPIPNNISFYAVALILGPLLGSFITEPAAITVTALILYDIYFKQDVSQKFKYITIAILFVNVSIGGTLTPFAAPPVLMVAGKWGWGMSHMISEFGWKCAVAIAINTIAAAFILRKELISLKSMSSTDSTKSTLTKALPPIWLIVVHIAFLGLVVYTSHYIVVFMGLFLFFIGVAAVTDEYQEPLKLKDSLLVGFFLGGLVLLGAQQKWWLEVVLQSLSTGTLFVGATALTAITDNAALTFLGSQVEGISDSFKFALVAGAVAGGGLTIIANAPNPAGYSVLKSAFGSEGINPLGLAAAALAPTLVAMACLWFLPNL